MLSSNALFVVIIDPETLATEFLVRRVEAGTDAAEDPGYKLRHVYSDKVSLYTRKEKLAGDCLEGFHQCCM